MSLHADMSQECSVCGALVAITAILKHRDWHRGMAEANERALDRSEAR